MKALKIEGTRGQYRLHAEDCRILRRSPRRWMSLDVLGELDGMVKLGTEGEPFKVHVQPRNLLTCRSCWQRCSFGEKAQAYWRSDARSEGR